MKTARIAVVAAAALLICGFGFRSVSVPDIESAQTSVFHGFDELERLHAYVQGQDGKMLGTIARTGADALGNEFGAGSKFKSDSVFNEFGKYGSKFADTSAFNPYATKPPKILVDQGDEIYIVGVLTVSDTVTTKGQRINPYLLQAWLRNK